MRNALIEGSFSSRELARAFAAGELGEEELRVLPAQTVYLAVQQAGLEACRVMLPMLSSEQYRALLDFEIWSGDRIDEEKFWNFLSTVDDERSLEPLGQFLDHVDHELLAMLMARYVDAVMYEDPSEVPPGKYWHTPDRGYTWIRFKVEDPERYRLLARLMAIIFEGQPELFYQLIAMPMSATPSELEEESYQLHLRRLTDIGIPEHEQAAAMNAPLDAASAAAQIGGGGSKRPGAPNEVAVLIEGAERLEPLAGLLDAVQRQTSAEEQQRARDELTYIANCSIVFFGIAFHDEALLQLHLQRVHGAINIGLQLVQGNTDAAPAEIYSGLGLAALYRVGLGELFRLRDRARAMAHPQERPSAEPEPDQAAEAVLACAREELPLLPMFFSPQGFLADAEGKLPGGLKAFTTLAELRAAEALITKEFAC